jgi:hypothetical protein
MTRVLIADDHAADRFDFRPVALVAPREFNEAIRVFELRSPISSADGGLALAST